jgi:hypothetical protein
LRGRPTLWMLPAMADQAGDQKAGQSAPEAEKASSEKPEPKEATGASDKPEAKEAAAAVTKEAPKAKKAPQTPPSERDINSPDWRALTLLFVIFGVTASSWGAARFACNMHPPESKPPPKLTTAQLAANPKDAAIEFIQRARSKDYDGALELALKDARTDLAVESTKCAKNAADCARQREAMAGLLTNAVVEHQDGMTADALATTYFKGEKKTFRVKLARDATVWKVVSYSAE